MNALLPALCRSVLVLVLVLLFGGCAQTPLRTLAPADEPAPPSVQSAPRPRVALVLSGGGLRGLAHLGVLRVLDAHGLRPDLVVGTSVGAIVGGVYASGVSAAALQAMPVAAELDPWNSLFVTPAGRSAGLEALLARTLAQRRLQDFAIPFVAVATAQRSGCLMLFGTGDAARAIVASSALPGALAPVTIAGQRYADGSLGAPLPVRVARALGAQIVIAVDSTFHAEATVPSGLLNAVFHAGMVMAYNLAAADRDAADLLLQPALPPVPEVTLANREHLAQAGEQAALQQLPQLRALFARGLSVLPPARQGLPMALCAPLDGPSAAGLRGLIDGGLARAP